MPISVTYRRRAKFVAVVNIILSVLSLASLGAWLGILLSGTPNVGAFVRTEEGKHILFLAGLVVAGAIYEGSLAAILLHGTVKENYTKVKCWFMTQTICLPIVTLLCLFNLARPHVPVLPFFLLVLIKSLSLWIVSHLVDEVAAEEQHQSTRLISPFDPPEEP